MHFLDKLATDRKTIGHHQRFCYNIPGLSYFSFVNLPELCAVK